jgi:POT family proton-dependent oligopeptide transporter
MTLGLIQYVAGRKYLVSRSEGKTAHKEAIEEVKAPKTKFTPEEWARIGAIIILSIFALMFWAGFEQAGSSLNLFADRATRLAIFGFTYPSSWFQSVEPLFIIIFAPIFAFMWIRLGPREPSSPVKFTLGLVFLSLSFALIVPAAHIYERTGQRVSPWWLIGLYFLQMVGELCLSPVGLSMVTKLAPASVVGLMMGIWFLATALGNYVAGWVAGFLENRPFSEVFQTAFISIAIAAVILLLLLRPIRRMMGGVR